jgi:nicotinate phosphoribosyltransferase
MVVFLLLNMLILVRMFVFFLLVLMFLCLSVFLLSFVFSSHPFFFFRLLCTSTSSISSCLLGGFEGTSNVLAGKLFHLPVSGTHAHSFVMSYSCLGDVPDSSFKSCVLQCRKDLGYTNTNEGELAAFIAYAIAFPGNYLALIDTYDMLESGVKNFLAVAWALVKSQNEKPLGIRIDSGDLAYFSKEIRKEFRKAATLTGISDFAKLMIVASNDINEDVLLALNREGHEIDIFGIGTHLVTCQKQPALGMLQMLSCGFLGFYLFSLSLQ